MQTVEGGLHVLEGQEVLTIREGTLEIEGDTWSVQIENKSLVGVSRQGDLEFLICRKTLLEGTVG